ncbi:MAG: sigma-54-dependent Fis family transcriptional regulator [Gammaproteobacteria bacterium]|nr:MAG: sigma-54-dependent Fis family transcriptional regulator [Gammaproteobacteria bacterium]UCH41769.1 MAG: sigma-54-dependent Fis family transcriptional regulator [Gammaproteobacteria bacterium]
MSRQRVLIVDDEPDIRELLEITLLRMGLETRSAEDYSNATRMLHDEAFDLCLTDMKLPDGDGIALVEHIQQHCPNTPTAVITAHGSIDLAIKAMKCGAFDFVSKPVSLETLRNLVDKALTLPSSPQVAGDPADTRYQIIGDSAVMQELKRSIAKFARSQAPVFIRGASGTGKELVARQIHLQGSRAGAAFVAVNCGAIPSELMESEFFGHLKGSFTGATSDNEGLFKAANGGTLFLDEIADLPLAMQVKLLRVIQEKSIRAVGAQQEEPIDVRIISASHKDLDAMVADGSFRQDLYYRINVIGVTVPTLLERTDDIAQLADYLIQKHNFLNRSNIAISDKALSALQAYPFPGNVRELENILERALALCENETIEVDDLQLPEIAADNGGETPSLGEMTQNLEKEQIISALEDNRWNQSATARALGLTLRQLRYRIDKLKLKND